MPKLRHRVTMPRPGDPDIIQAYTDAMKIGLPLGTCATMAGISADTARDWLRLGTEALGAAPDKTAEELGSHALFAWSVKQADAAFVLDNVAVINACKTGSKGWLPAMTHLERMKPQDFGRFQRIEVEQRTVTVNLTAQLPPEAARALLDMAQAEATAPAPKSPTAGSERLLSSPAPQHPDSD